MSGVLRLDTRTWDYIAMPRSLTLRLETFPMLKKIKDCHKDLAIEAFSPISSHISANYHGTLIFF